jgi:hypothetical protein
MKGSVRASTPVATLGVTRHQGPQDTLADTAIGNPKAFPRPNVENRFQDCTTSDHQIRPFVANRREFRASIGR